MKATLSAAVCAAAVLAAAPSAFAAEGEAGKISNYVTLGAGLGIMDSAELSATGESVDVDMAMPTDFVAAFGWQGEINKDWGWRAEAEFSYLRSELDSADSGGTISLGGTLNIMALSANGYIDWHLNEQWTVYGGLGLGVNMSDVSLTTGGSGVADSTVCYQAQLMLGGVYHINHTFDVFAEYRAIFPLTENEITLGGPSADFDPGLSHHILVGVRVHV